LSWVCNVNFLRILRAARFALYEKEHMSCQE